MSNHIEIQSRIIESSKAKEWSLAKLVTIIGFVKRIKDLVNQLKPDKFAEFKKVTQNLSLIDLEIAKTTSIYSVVQWHRWHNYQQSAAEPNLKGYKQTRYGYDMIFHQNENITNLFVCEILKNWSCDIKDVDSVLASKSDLAKFTNLNQIVTTNACELITEISEESFHKNLSHKGIRLLHNNPSYSLDNFQIHAWDDRLFFMNSDGSHHFAAARYIAVKQNLSFQLTGELHKYVINNEVLSSLLKDFSIYVIPTTAYDWFHYFMEKHEVSYLFKQMPEPHVGYMAIFLPTNNEASMQISSILKSNRVYNLGEYFADMRPKKKDVMPPLFNNPNVNK